MGNYWKYIPDKKKTNIIFNGDLKSNTLHWKKHSVTKALCGVLSHTSLKLLVLRFFREET